MVTIGMNYRVIAGKERVFEEAFHKVVKALQGVEGHTESHVFRDVNEPQHYLIISQWAKKAAFDAFIASDTFKKVANWGKEQVLSDRPHHEIYGGDEPGPGGQRPSYGSP